MNYYNLEGRDELEFYKMLVETLSQMATITVLGPDGKFTFASQPFLNAINVTPDELKGKGSKEMVEEGYYGSNSSIKAFNSKTDAKTIFYSKERHFVLSESKVALDEKENIKYIVTLCSLPLEIYHEVDALQEKMKSYESEIQALRSINLKEAFKEETSLIFRSKEMHTLFSNLKKVAPTNASVLLLGESGVGKEVIAKSIHFNSNRKEKPFVPICVPLISPTLLEAELFGYVKGAFTNADKEGKVGLFEVANGGTVFLDEVGDIPLDIQVKLLRVLEKREISRVGSSQITQLDIRIIAATNKDLHEMVRKGQFREDLLYRLNMIQMNVKPLRERKDDIIPLANYFIDIINKSYGYNKVFLSEAYDALEKYNWPGNVRELKNIIEKVIILSDGVFISANDILASINNNLSERNMINQTALKFENQEKSIIHTYNTINRQQILEALINSKGNRSKAAELLGISRSTLYRIMKEE
jgi:transcriptional regulator with PAS, ATPase and Fis domain